MPNSVTINALQALPENWDPDHITHRFLALEGITNASIEITFLSDSEIHQINRQHLAHDYPTDVITFVLATDPLMVDIYISCDTAACNADIAGHGLADELSILIAHGVLHATGYDDDTPEAKLAMFARQDQLVAAL